MKENYTEFQMAMLPPDPVYIFKGNMLSISCVTFKFSPSMECLFAGTQAGIVHVWSLKTKREIGNFKIGNDTCLSINFYEDVIITHDKCGNISFWKESNNEWILIKQIKIDFFGFCKSCIFEDFIYTSLKNSRCQLISLKTFELFKIISFADNNKTGEIMAFKINILNNIKTILIAYEGHQLVLWDLNKVEKLSELKLSECPMTVDFDINTSRGICGDPSDKILIFSLSKDLKFKVEKEVTLTNAGVASVQIRQDSKLVAVGCWDGKLRLYSWKTMVLLAVLDTHSMTIQDVCFSEKLREGEKLKYLLAAASKDCRVSLWDLYN